MALRRSSEAPGGDPGGQGWAVLRNGGPARFCRGRMISESDVFTAFGVALGLAGAWAGGLAEMGEKGWRCEREPSGDTHRL